MIPRTTFRRKLLLLALLPLALAQLVTVYAVMRTVERDVAERAHESLRIGAAVVDEYLKGRGEQLRTSIQVLAADFGLKEAVATGDAATIRSVLQNHGDRVAADIAVLLSLDGRVIASTDATLHPEREFMDSTALDEENRRAVQSTEVIGGAVYQVFAVPLRAPTPIAWVVMGFSLDSGMIDRMVALTGLDLALVGGRDEVRLLSRSTGGIDTTDMPEDLLHDGSPTEAIYVVNGIAADYLATTTQFVAGPQNNANVEVVLLRSITDAMAPYAEARRGLVLFGLILLLAVAAAGVWVSGSIAKPLNILTNAARKLKSGDYDVHVRVPSRDEVGELASSFNAMATAIAEREERISHQALHDPLTDLPNYVNLSRQLERLISESSGDDRIYVLSIRLSRMNTISSTLGHSASDELIALAARLLQVNLDPGEVLGQVGSEEFIVILPRGEVHEAFECAEKLRGILATGVSLGRATISLQSSFGIATYPEHGKEAAEVLRKASIARSETESGGEQIGVYQKGREDYYVRQLRLVNDLRGALSRHEVEVWYQPKISLPDGSAHGAEALVRWQHPEYGWLSPDEFVPASEEAGTIMHLTRYVLRDAISECRAWQDAGYPLHVSVNISTRDLCDDYLPYFVLQLLKEQAIPPERLTLEVTENSVMQQLARASTVLECLRDVGVRISMDDFGTGQSSLAQLRHMPLHELKVDKSFVMTLPEDPQNEEIVRATLKLARSLGLDVVAEGVENEQALRFLAELGCQQAQGYFVSKPVSPADFMRWLEGFKPVACRERRRAKRPFRRKA